MRFQYEVGSVAGLLLDYTTELWTEIDSSIQLQDCCVYSYINDLSDDPLSDGQLYSYHMLNEV